MEQLFEQATRKKLRFSTVSGTLSVEDLWDLPLTSKNFLNLDTLAQALNAQVKETEGTISFVTPEKSPKNEELELSFEIVKHIIAVKVAERDARKDANERADKKQKLLALLDKKENEQLEGLSAEELRKQIAEL